MANIILKQSLSALDKIAIMQESAAYDIADGDKFASGDYSLPADCAAATPDALGISNIKAKPSPPKVPKVFVSNDCVFNCQYCGCRAERDKPRYTHEPAEIADIALKAAKGNGHGVFITSAIRKNADYTEELILETLRIMRYEYGYKGYLHAKIMPGADPRLIKQAGFLADRISVNIELAHSDGYKTLAKQKNKNNILTPMTVIRDYIDDFNPESGRRAFSEAGRPFAPSGQTTQMMPGALSESDRTIALLAESLYRKFGMRRVYYSPFNTPDDNYSIPDLKTPRWRGRRLYQADRLMQLYGMKADEILPESAPNLDFDIDPKASYALRNINMFPVEVNTADYELLIRTPGIGVTSARKIIQARKKVTLTHDILKQMGVSLKKSVYFITCGGKYNGAGALGSPMLRQKLWADWFVFMQNMEQSSIFDVYPNLFDCLYK